jgi:putative peptide zinc metalloprotease protein
MLIPRARTSLAAVFVTAAAVLAFQAPVAHAGASDTTALAINTHDGTAEFRLRMSIHKDNGDVVTPTNAAVAYASCVDCRAVAVSFQLVFRDDDASVVAPVNIALASNVGCDGCETLAGAYQYIWPTDEKPKFSDAGKQAIKDVRRDLKQLRKDADALSLDEIRAELDRLDIALVDVLAREFPLG